ncbi:hypothetical protein BDN71DRAFT_1504961 [Pleurotus eryngii]|uniref:Uncharacterized protein n=1 Tax=Pleurotus eryngii TaxID=5323 RepID=A0A9P5ZZJ9_PLEER|nr:hypothetical protein BDN71DRAFT_1504961 [Pleurotus eryngii]
MDQCINESPYLNAVIANTDIQHPNRRRSSWTRIRRGKRRSSLEPRSNFRLVRRIYKTPLLFRRGAESKEALRETYSIAHVLSPPLTHPTTRRRALSLSSPTSPFIQLSHALPLRHSAPNPRPSACFPFARDRATPLTRRLTHTTTIDRLQPHNLSNPTPSHSDLDSRHRLRFPTSPGASPTPI